MAALSGTRARHFASLVLLVLVAFYTTLASAAYSVLDLSELPSCAASCTALTSANSDCVPPIAPVTNQGAYQSCFCSFNSLSTLYSTGSSLCSSVCSSTDDATIQKWYVQLCTGGKVVTPGATASTASQTSTGTTSTGTSASSQTGSAQSGTADASTQANVNRSWISTHWQWVLLLIVVFLLFVVGLIGGFWLKRRIRRRRDVHRFSNPRLAGSPSPFGSGALTSADAAYMSSRNHPQMTVVPGAGSEAAMARYDGSGVSTADGRRSRGVSAAYDIADGYYGGEMSRSRELVVPSPPPQGTGTSRGSTRRTLRPSQMGADDIEAVAAGPRKSMESKRSFKNKLKRGVK